MENHNNKRGEHHQAVEQELLELKSHVQSLLQTAKGFFIYRVALDSGIPPKVRVIMVSPSVSDVAGIKDVDNFESWFTNVHPEDLPKVMEANRLSIATGTPYDQVTRWYHPVRCEWIWVRTMSQPVLNSEGVISHFNGLCIDISEQKRSEEELQASESRFRCLIEGAPEAMFVQSEGCCLYMNPAMLKLIGATKAEEMRGGDMFARVAPEYHDIIRERMQQQRLSSTPVPLLEMESLKLDGTRIPVETTSVAILYENRNANLVFVRDITERKRNEKALHEKNVALDQSVTQLRNLAMELTRAEERERKRLATKLHDDVQQWLVAATMKIGLLNEPLSDEEHDRMVQEAQHLVGEALNATRSMATDLYPPVLLDGGLLPGLRWLANRMRETHDLTVEVASAEVQNVPEPLSILLFQGVRELLFNVVKHANKKSARIAVSQPDLKTIRIEVSDCGIGFSANNATQGLGMFYLRERLACIGGSFDVASEPGQGTRVWITAPIG